MHIAILSFQEGLKANTFAGYSQSQKIIDAMLVIASSAEHKAKGRGPVRLSRLAWDDNTIDWNSVDLAIPIEVWSYYEKIPQFISWLDKMASGTFRTRLANGVNVVRFNVCKVYLAAMEKRGVSIVPTVFVANPNAPRNNSGIRPFYTISDSLVSYSSEEPSLKSFISLMKNGLIVKPTISAGAFQTLRVSQAETSVSKALELAEVSVKGLPLYVDAMVQPYLPEIEGDGERSIVFIRGKISHCIRKVPKEGDFRVQKRHGGQYQTFAPSEEEIKFGENALQTAQALVDSTFPGGGPANLIVYARCDYVIADDGTGQRKPLLMELEMIEPELFIPYSPQGESGFEEVGNAFLSLAL